VRWSGPFGPRLVSGWTSRRFSMLPEAEAQALHDYSYALFRQRGSSEYALAYLLAPGAFARSPLIRRIGGVGRQPGDGDAGVPTVFMYGEHDWMDVAGGYAAVEKMKERGSEDAKVVIINKAGHHVYLDGWEQFNRVMGEEMGDVVRRKRG
jgi:cardiolipin-specific phospholipase